MGGRWRCLLVLALLCASSVPSAALAASGLGSSSALDVPCQAAAGHFSGDCRFGNDAGSPYACDVDYDARTYTRGCKVLNLAAPAPMPTATAPAPTQVISPTSTPIPDPPQSVVWSPTDLGAGCEHDKVQGGYWCPGNDRGHFYPAPGYVCTYNENNANWECKSPGPPANQNCTYDPSNENYVCTGPSPSPSASPSPSGDPCAASGGSNLICNGDFADPPAPTVSEVVGVWLNTAGTRGANSGCDSYTYPQYGYDDRTAGRAQVGSAGLDGNSCAIQRRAGMVGGIRQNFVGPAGGQPINWTVGVDLYGTDWHFSYATDRILVQLKIVVTNPGDGGTNGIYLDDAKCVPTASGAGGGYVAERGAWRVLPSGALHLACAFEWHDGNPFTGYYFSAVEVGDGATYSAAEIDNVVVRAAGDGPSPSPSPSPSGSPSPSPSPGSGVWNCTYNESNENYTCTQPGPPPSGGVPKIGNCVFDPANENYVCTGNPPASPLPYPSAGFPTRTPGAGGGATPVAGVPGPSAAPGGGGTAGCVAASALDLPGHAAFVGCMILGFEDQIYGIGEAFAVGLQFLMDLGRVAVSVARELVSVIGNVVGLVRWTAEMMAAVFSTVAAALSAPPASADLTLWGQLRAAFPPLRLLLNGLGVLVWLKVFLWIFHEAGKMANG